MLTKPNGNFLLDTNIVAALWKNEPSVIAHLAQANAIFVPSIVVGELLFGAYNSNRQSSDLVRIRAFVRAYNLLLPDEAVADWYGQIRAALRRKGQPIPENDVWIAAIARHHTLTLVSRDAHFAAIDGLTVVTWL
jgi:tRNA(fMet)-specific endonuclease VapC